MKQQDVICTVKAPKDGAHDLSAVKAAQADGWRVVNWISDCQSAIIYLLEKGADDAPSSS